MTAQIGGFFALAALMVALFAWIRRDMGVLREDMRGMEARMNDRFERLEARFAAVEARLAAVERGQAKLEGLLEGLREAIAGRTAAAQ